MNDEPADRTERTICPWCAVGCSLRYNERTGRATRVEGAPVSESRIPVVSRVETVTL